MVTSNGPADYQLDWENLEHIGKVLKGLAEILEGLKKIQEIS